MTLVGFIKVTAHSLAHDVTERLPDVVDGEHEAALTNAMYHEVMRAIEKCIAADRKARKLPPLGPKGPAYQA